MDTTLPFTLELYPHEPPRKSRLGSVALSLSVHVVAVAILAVLHFEAVPTTFQRPHSVTLVAPTPLELRPYVPEPPKTAPLAKPSLSSPPAMESPSAPARTARTFEAPPPKLVRQNSLTTLELPAASIVPPMNPPLTTTAHLPVIPAPPLKTDNFALAERASIAPIASQTQAAGFGSTAVSSAAPKNSTSTTGGFASSTVASDRVGGSSKSLLATGGFGATNTGNQPVVAARIATTGGFANTTLERVADNFPPPNSKRPSGFGDALIASAPAASVKMRPSSDTPVQILEKPNPAYTEEARRLRIEGEVLIEILFPATGPARVVRILRGLGHGLDENAAAAAQSIVFRPATQSGQPVDSTAVVHIAFQVAY